MKTKRYRPGNGAWATLALLVVAVAAGAFLFSTRANRSVGNATLGGPLLKPGSAPVDALLFARMGRQFRLDRLTAGGWTLGGDVADDVDSRAMAALLDTLAAAKAGPVLPGTEPGDRRYEFNGPEALHLVVHRTDGSSEELDLGIVNPVTGTRYASGAGRDFCFTVKAALRDRLAALPELVRARTLLPAVEAANLERITIERDGGPYVLARRDGRWWLLASNGAVAFGDLAARYQAQYADRQQRDTEGLWLQASSSAVVTLVYELTEVLVRDLAPAERTAELSAAWGLDSPWRRVTLAGANLRPTLAGATGDAGAAPVLAFGPPLDDQNVPVLRRGNVIVADREAIRTLEMPVAALVDVGALPFTAMTADALEIAYEGRVVLRGSRRGEVGASDGRAAWMTDAPVQADWKGTEAARNGLTRDLVVNLDRQPLIAVLSPCTSPDPLRDDGRVRVTLNRGAGGPAETCELGWLREPVAGATVAMWSPSTGRLVGIGDALPVSVRNLAGLVGAPRP
jgi:hypothetical protein